MSGHLSNIDEINEIFNVSSFFKVRRVLDIWGERQVFPDKFLKELVAILESGKKKDIHDIVDSFQPNQLCTQIKIMKALEDDTEYKLKTLSKSSINNIFD